MESWQYRHRRSFLPVAIELYNSSPYISWHHFPLHCIPSWAIIALLHLDILFPFFLLILLWMFFRLWFFSFLLDWEQLFSSWILNLWNHCLSITIIMQFIIPWRQWPKICDPKTSINWNYISGNKVQPTLLTSPASHPHNVTDWSRLAWPSKTSSSIQIHKARDISIL